MPFGQATIAGADSDSSSFLRRSIPALTIHGLTEDWPKILHSKNDQATKVNPLSVYLGYRLALALVLRLDNLPCKEFKDLDVSLN
nr:L304 [uncultured bacterium]